MTHPLTRTTQGLALVLGPVLTAVNTFYWNSRGAEAVTGSVIGAAATVIWFYGLLALWESIREKRPVLGTVGTMLAVLGAFGGTAFALHDFFKAVYGYTNDQSLDALAEHPVGASLMLWLSGPMFPASLFVLGIALLLTRPAPRWVAVLYCVSAVAYPLSRIPDDEAVAHVVDVLLLVPSVYLGVVMLLSVPRPARRAAA